MIKRLTSAAVLLTPALSLAVTVDLNELPLSPDSFYNGGDGNGGFTSQGVEFNNVFTDWGGGSTSWTGWSYSNINDTTTPGYENQYAAFTGTGVGGGGIYAVHYVGDPTANRIELPHAATVYSAAITNTTYAALSMLNGDSFAKQFGGASGDDPDWFLLTITGKDTEGSVTGSVGFYLADYRFANNAEDYIVDTWETVDLSTLGDSVKSLEFTLSSSDTSGGWMNTPGYFALDNLEVSAVPEPTGLAGVLLLGSVALRRRRIG